MKHLSTAIRVPIEPNDPAICREENLCIQCGNCKNICHNRQGVAGYFDLEKTGNCGICIHCGQCINYCPVDSLHEKFDYQHVREILRNSDKTVFVQTSPSTRVGISEACGMAVGTFGEGKLVSALKKLGFKYVFDANFAADLTVMEDASELVARLTTPDSPLPMFTSCCPAWVKFAELFYPQILPNLSTARSPLLMVGPTLKCHYAKKFGINPNDVYNVAVTPCTAKKFEITREEFNSSGKYNNNSQMRDMDAIITVRELAKWLKEENIDFETLPDTPYDSLCGSGAGAIFANSGGVMEAALRTANYLLTGADVPKDFLNLTPVRGMDGVKEATVEIAGKKIRACVIHTTNNARKFLDDFANNSKKYDFIEVMACLGGCIGGGGQPKCDNDYREDVIKARIAAIYKRDNQMAIRYSHHNPEIQALYKDFYGKPLSKLAEDLLHSSYKSRAETLNVNNTTNLNKLGGKIMDFKTSKTAANLAYAFAGESQARNRYTFFASVAKKEGYEQISSIFEATANNEKEHAKLWFKALSGIGNTMENLAAAAAGEHEEWTHMYKEFSEVARAEGFDALADQLAEVAKIEKRHEERYRKLLANIKNGEVFARPEAKRWECRNCGHIHVGEKAPETCPACKHPQAYFEITAENF